MPTIFSYIGLVFKFFSDDHYPIHVHVIQGEYESIYDLVIVDNKLVELKKRKKRGKEHLKEADAKNAEKFIYTYYQKIIDKWTDYFVRNIAIKPVTITKKI
ncbi:MAG: DUF4160 domain-containing protein [Bacteroidales bacterium]|nr:DUF4160 domain-containing protein [Bacteroidales bacterium]